MSPRVIHIPLSGRDRKYYTRQLKQAEATHARLTGELAVARARVARLECEEWSARQFIGGDVEPSPTIAAALLAGTPLLLVECRACGHGDRIDLAEVVWPRDKPVHSLGKVLACASCKREGRARRRPNLVGLQTRDPDMLPPGAMAGPR